MTTAIRRRFDRAGASYEGVALVQRQVAERLAGLCPAVLGDSVLEIGAGSGLLTRLLAPRHGHGPYVALDLSPGMLRPAAMPGALKIAADGEHPPFRPESFDFLASASAMHWYAEPAVSIPADLRLVRPGGGFALALYVEGTLGEIGQASRETGFGSIFPMRPVSFYRELFTALPGLADRRIEEERLTVRHESVAALLRSLKGAGVTHTPGRSQGSPNRYKDFTRYYEAHFGDAAGVSASYAVCYLTGRLDLASP